MSSSVHRLREGIAKSKSTAEVAGNFPLDERVIEGQPEESTTKARVKLTST